MIDKPSHVFDRDHEWSALARFATAESPSARLGVVSGRRRQGKTFLLDALISVTGGFYFLATDDTGPEGLRRFGEALGQHTGIGRYAFTNWDEAIDRLYLSLPESIVVIDEFPYLAKASPVLPSLLQHALDPGQIARRGRTKLLLCGSAMSVMGGLLSGSAPLRGRAGLELVVNPMGYRTAAQLWGVDDDPWLAASLHGIVGGTPAYRHEFVNDDTPASRGDFDDWVVRTVLNLAVPLYREARYLLAEEAGIRDPTVYHAVLAAISGGHTTRGGIANYLGRPSTHISQPLAVLEDCGLITKEPDAFRSGRAYFRIAEPLITFYEQVMRPTWGLLERNRAAAAWQQARATFSSQVMGPHFETLCREFALVDGLELFGHLPGDVAAGTVADPDDRGQIQVDVAVLSPGDPSRPRTVLSLGEAKWGKVMGLRHLQRLRRARDLLAVKGYDTSGTVLACYGGAGFDDDLRAEAARDRRVLLAGLDAVYGR